MRHIDWRWWLAVPAGMLSWVLVDLLLPFVLDLIFYYSFLVIAFLSHFAAVVSAGLIAPRRYSRIAVLVIAVMFISIRLIMIVSVLNQDSIAQYLLGTLFILAGLGLGTLLVLRRSIALPEKQPGS
ncbi:MAG: hypothetical protein JSU61_13750 [Fidelibacterota bacterium]|nr:MAG: hypothetical protein JSU61_13750 [Candidatus Neomarinimicrobiota bacterium]